MDGIDIDDVTDGLVRTMASLKKYEFTNESTKPKVGNEKFVFLGVNAIGRLVCRTDINWAEYYPVDDFYKKDARTAVGFFTSKWKAISMAKAHFSEQKAIMVNELEKRKEAVEDEFKNLEKYASAWDI